MSGGFFRGTSADQDTRFSNKQAKLLKTQKFAQELDHLVDMTKVKMDVMKPWIAKRVTELLGFEDEVLINFVYGLLDAKEVDGKQIQIQLTGFMEKNTGKFMKELWVLLLSAQKNASGVPQQFLDEKEEEMKKKMVESERITQEIQKRREREGQDAIQMNLKGMDGEADITRHMDAASTALLKHSGGRPSTANPEDERETDRRRVSRRTSRQRSPSYHSDGKSPFPQKGSHAVTKSRSRSFSRSRSYSDDGRKSRDASLSASPPRHLHSQDRRRRSLPRYSVSPHRHRSPQVPASRRRSPYARRRSSPRLHHRSPSPFRRRSPVRVRRRSPSPRLRRPSPIRRRSRSPPRRRSPPRSHRQSPSRRHHRSPSPSWRKSPIHRRSPVKLRRRSPSPANHKSPSRRISLSPMKHNSPSPLKRSPQPRSPKHRRISLRHSPRQRAADSQSSPRQMNRSHNTNQSRSSSQSHSSSSREQSNRPGVEVGSATDPPEGFTEEVSLLDEEVEYGPGKMDGNLSPNLIGQERSSSKKVARDYSSPGRRPTKEQDFAKNSHLDEALRNDDRKRPRVEENDRICPVDTDSEDKSRAQKTERRPKKSDQKETSLEDESDYDSATERRKELKRRKREERRLRKEEKRRRREERHRKREERRAQKMSKDVHTVGSHPDKERNYSAAEESDEEAGLKFSITTDTEERETDQKKLEIELRKKALESLRAKKAINH